MNQDELSIMRHTLAHLLAAAVRELYPHARPTIGPAVENGFYYDFDFSDGPKPAESDLMKIEQKMREQLKKWDCIQGEKVREHDAREHFSTNPYKLELIEEIIARKEPLTFYHSCICTDPNTDPTESPNACLFTDLCRGGHTEHPAKEIPSGGFKLDRIAGAYWRGDEKNTMLTRIYGLAFESKEELQAYIARREEAKLRDHKKIGRELDLFYIDEEVGKGLPMWTPKGTAVKFELEAFTRDLERKYGYEHVCTPYLANKKLYETSGHLSHYSESMYAPITMDDEQYYLRPMACPHHIKLLQRAPISYRDLPVRYAEIADYNRHEKSGELMGMIRVRKFQLTDGHIFVSPEGLKDEFINVCKMIQEGMRGLGIDDIVSYRFSKRDPENKEKYYPDDDLWNKAESVMKEALDEIGLNYVEAEDEAAFYGPKLDVQASNVNGKEDTLFTAQMDFLLPEKFNIEYTAEDGSKKRPAMIHRSAIGALERVFAFLVEHTGGVFPLWLAPEQVRVLPVGEAHQAYAQELYDTLKAEGIRVSIAAEESLGKRIRYVKKEKVPYFIVLGDKEVESNAIKLETRDGEGESFSKDELLSRLKQEIAART